MFETSSASTMSESVRRRETLARGIETRDAVPVFMNCGTWNCRATGVRSTTACARARRVADTRRQSASAIKLTPATNSAPDVTRTQLTLSGYSCRYGANEEGTASYEWFIREAAIA